MTKYLDKNDEIIKEGFYIQKELNALFYFTGKYDIEEFPIFKVEGDSKKRYSLYQNLVQQLLRVDGEKLKEEIKKSKEKEDWIKQKLKK
jgi:hypothetical protein